MNLVLAAGEHAEVMAADWMPAVTALVVFLLAFGFLYVKVWPKILQGLDDRQAKIRSEIKAAEEAREQARAALATYEQELAGARQEASRLIAAAKADAKAVAAELRASNEAQITEMKQRALRELESARRSAVSELHAEAANLAADIASKILKREITPQDQQRLVDESLQELAGGRRR
jgi:F-type H+-transporting ATPase subunit b